MCEVSPDCSVDLRPFFTFYGGKWRSAPLYPEPKYGTIVEPFAGSAGYSMRYHWLNVILIEIDPAIAEVWKYLIKVNPSEILSLPNIRCGERPDDLIGISEEARLLIKWWCGKGRREPAQVRSSWGGEQCWSQFWSSRIRGRIASQVEHIRHWEIVHDSYENIDPFLATWFVDPPYTAQSYRYVYGEIDRDHLTDWCLNLEGQVIVCEDQYAKWLPFEKLSSALTNNGYTFDEYMFHAEL